MIRVLSRLLKVSPNIFPLLCICGFAVLFVMIATPVPAIAQTTPIPDPLSSNTNATAPTMEITTPQDGQKVPVGELTIKGKSSDNDESNCQVYADVNDVPPLQNATATGNSGAKDDYSQWIFTYAENYQLITNGANELTAKISCYDSNNPTPMSKWHSINVTGGT